MDVAQDVARRYRGRGIDQDDLTQVAYAALTRAARSFRPELACDFLSYAVPTIRGELKKHFRDQGWTIRIPRRLQNAQAEIAHAEGEMFQQFGRPPTAPEIAAHLGLDLQDVVEAMSAQACFTPVSLDRPLSDADGVTTVADQLGQQDAHQSATEAKVILAPIVRRLRARDQRILYLRFVHGWTQQEIANDIGVTQMQVSRLLARIMHELRIQVGPVDVSRSGGARAPLR